MESRFGIEKYVSDCRGFTCVLKQRYQDFLVNEIDRNGRIVRLTNLDAPESVSDEKQESSQTAATDEITLWNSDIDQQFRDLVAGTKTEAVSIQCQGMDKAERTEIHNAIRQRYPILQSATSAVGTDGTQVITVTKSGSGQQSRKRKHWSERQEDYTRFVLYKENKDSHFALSLISRLLGTNVNSIHLAGTKDRRGATSQLATIYRVPARQLSALNPQLRGIKLGNFEYCKDELRLGESGGNRFTVVMRNIKEDRIFVEEEVKKWTEKGFINYFGSQRFGTSSVSTHAIGKAILKKQWSEVVDLLLSPKDDSSDDLYECCRIWSSSKDPNKSFEAIPFKRRRTSIEGQLLTGLKKHGINDFSNAFRFVPRNSRTLYVHSFQSYVWNKLVSKRVDNYGQRLLEGDSVVSENGAGDAKPEARAVTSEELGETEVFALRIPLPSANVEFANNEMSKWLDEILNEEGVAKDDFKDAEKDYAVHGDIRQAFVKPLDVEFQFYQYDDPTIPLALTDYDILQGTPEPQSVENGKYSAVSLQFSLPPGSYATMAIRELCRMDTGKQYQSSLNDYTIDDDIKEKDNTASASV